MRPMKPTLTDVRPVTDTHFDAVERVLGVTLSPRLRAALREVNGGSPTPSDVPCDVYSGDTHVPVHEFCRWDDPAEYVALARTYRDDLFVPARFLVFATADADTFFIDIEDPDFRVMYSQYVEGDYGSQFQDGEMDRAAESVEAFLDSFFDADVG